MANHRPAWSLIPGDWVQLNRIINELGWSVLKTTTPLWDLDSGNTSLHSGSLVLPGVSGVLKAAAITGIVSGSATHSDLGGVTANQHHNQSHVLNGSDHTVSGLTTGHVLQALSATTFGFAAVPGLHDAVTLATSADVLLGLTGQQLSLDTQTAAYVLAGPTTGAATAPTFRALVATDIPALAYEASGAIAAHAALTTGVHGLAITAGQTLTVTTGGTLGSAAYTASTAYDVAGAAAAVTPTTLGLVIGTNTQAYSAKLTAIAGLAATDSNIIVGDGSTWVAESGATARTTLGLGTTDIATFLGLVVDTKTLSVDSATHRLGVGTVTPAYDVQVLTQVANSACNFAIRGARTNANQGANIIMGHSRGSIGSETATQSGDIIGDFGGAGWGTTVAKGKGAGYRFIAAESFTDSVNGSWLGIYTTPIGSASAVVVAAISSAGNLGVGFSTDAGPLEKLHSSANVRADGVFNCNGTAGLASQVVALAKLTTLGSDGSITIKGGIVTAYTAPT